ncbi:MULTISPECIES: metal-sensing transcriptional repressor [unclassified Rhizobium]|uniref:metal-sensing transcriptional repressor n=1 Tax=Rhizobium sp. BK312 TaxID=2587080 RepID=UPI000DD4B6B1
MTEHTRATHPKAVKRLKRSEDHANSVTGMIGGGKPCLDIARQLSVADRRTQHQCEIPPAA